MRLKKVMGLKKKVVDLKKKMMSSKLLDQSSTTIAEPGLKQGALEELILSYRLTPRPVLLATVRTNLPDPEVEAQRPMEEMNQNQAH